jgi:hypothetical protein
VKYRFFNADKIRMTRFNGAEADYRFRSHSLLGGLTFNFGGREPFVDTPPPPPPPLEPPPSRLRRRRRLPRASPVRSWSSSTGIGRHHSAGFGDPRQRGFRLSDLRPGPGDDRRSRRQVGFGPVQRRSFAASRRDVRSYLAGRGVPDGVMTTEAFGESRPLVETADGVREPQNRRVEISYGPGSGW